MSPIGEFTCELIRRRSVTPDDAGCQALIAERLTALGFEVSHLRFGAVDNLWARRGKAAPVFAFAGHTDVVPSGPTSAWSNDPFSPTMRDGYLFGRGAADMKGSLAAMLAAAEAFLGEREPRGSLAFLITSDEEGDAVDGTRRVMQWLADRGEHIDFCVVGEPSSSERLGDVVRVGRRGSLNGRLTVRGVQGHVAYPEAVCNPIHAALEPLRRLAERQWDSGDEPFPPTTFQISNIHAGSGASNVVPGELEAAFNFRYCTAQTSDGLRAAVESCIADHLGAPPLTWNIDWTISGEPFLTRPGRLTAAVQEALSETLGVLPSWSTSGGTSDGRFIAPSGAQVVELGPCNATIHKVDECVRIADLDRLAEAYAGILRRLL